MGTGSEGTEAEALTAVGIVSRWPGKMRSGSAMPLAEASAEAVVEWRRAIPDSVSPPATTWTDPCEAAGTRAREPAVDSPTAASVTGTAAGPETTARAGRSCAAGSDEALACDPAWEVGVRTPRAAVAVARAVDVRVTYVRMDMRCLQVSRLCNELSMRIVMIP